MPLDEQYEILSRAGCLARHTGDKPNAQIAAARESVIRPHQPLEQGVDPNSLESMGSLSFSASLLPSHRLRPRWRVLGHLI